MARADRLIAQAASPLDDAGSSKASNPGASLPENRADAASEGERKALSVGTSTREQGQRAASTAVPAGSAERSDGLVDRAQSLIAQTERLMARADRLIALAALPPDDSRPSALADPVASSLENQGGAAREVEKHTPPVSTHATEPESPMVGTAKPAWAAPKSERLVDRADRVIAQTDRLMARADRLIAQAASSPGEAQPPAELAPPASTEPAAVTEPEKKAPEPQAPPSGAGEPPSGVGEKEQPTSSTAEKDQAAPGAAQPGATQKDQPTSGAASKDQPAEEEREVARVPLAAVQAGGLLLARDQLIVEPSLFYTYSQNTRLIVTGFSVLPLIILGDLESEKVTSNLVSAALQLRYGLYRGLQLDFRLPYTYVDQSRLRVASDRAGQVEETQHDYGIGDVNFGLTYQFLYERGWLPDLMLRVGANAPTGQSQFDVFKKIAQKGALGSAEQFLHALNSSGVALGAGRWTITTSVNGVKALDPAILFGTVGWNYTPASTENLIQITSQPVSGGVLLSPTIVSARLGAVNGLLVSMGLAISLNNQLSVNFSFSEVINKSTTANDVKIPGSQTNVGQFNFGMNLAISPQTTLNFVGQIGITPDAPDMSFLVSVPVFYNNAMETAYTSLKSSFTDFFRRKPAPVEKPVEKPKETSG